MVIYAIGTLPLIHHLDICLASQVWYADDAAACGSICFLREWWNELCTVGPSFGYHPNPSKSWLILKPEFADLTSSVIDDVKLNYNTDGHKYLGSAIGSEDFITKFIKEKVSEWITQLEVLTSIAQTQPHAAYSAFIHGLLNK